MITDWLGRLPLGSCAVVAAAMRAPELFESDDEDDELLVRDAPLNAGDLFALAEVGREGRHLGAQFALQPLDDSGAVEPAGIGEDDLLDRA